MQDKRVHGGATVGAMVQDPKPRKAEKIKDVVNVEDMNVDITKMDSNGVNLPSPASFGWKQFGVLQQARLPVDDGGISAAPVLVSEGRVRGGSLMALLTGNSGIGPSEPGKSYVMPHNWMM